jgi:putative transposase
MGNKKWTIDKKIEILSEGEKKGVLQTCRLYEVGTTTYYDWKKKFELGGIEELKNKKIPKIDPELNKLLKENRLLKNIIADKELEIRIKNDLKKKTLQNKKLKRR